MTPLKPWFWPQSQTSYDRMYTRMGSFDFATKLKITPQTLMPGFGPFYRSILLNDKFSTPRHFAKQSECWLSLKTNLTTD